MDGNIKEKREVPAGYKYITPNVQQPGYNEAWKKRVAEDTRDKLLVPEGEGH